MRRVSTVLIPALALSCVALMTVSAGAQNPGGSPEGKKMKNPVASSPESIKAGQAAFQKNCRFCHGADAKGNGPMAPECTHPSNLTDDKWDHGGTDGEIFASIHDGIGPKFDMKAQKEKISDTDIWLHLMTGRHTLEHRALTVPDPFSFTSSINSPNFPDEAKTRYFNLTHEWLAQIVMYLIHSAAGFPGPASLTFTEARPASCSTRNSTGSPGRE